MAVITPADMTHEPSTVATPTAIPSPFVVIIDSREQSPFTFADLRADAVQGRAPIAVRTVVRGLPSGDYSLDGFESVIAVERKSIADLFGTLGRGRARFTRELERLDAMDFAAVVIEADWRDIINDPPERSKLNPKTIHRSVVAWQQRYPRVHWWMCSSRTFAERTTYRILERFHKDHARPNGKKRSRR